ncbi:hypothetical protein QBC43DRAFT_358938 [Cladorrhinum sp. PSN259]|nr:hypothetical protein QBC43DRAFT_358938 [Cladorrhinum sp. PSN259]
MNSDLGRRPQNGHKTWCGECGQHLLSMLLTFEIYDFDLPLATKHSYCMACYGKIITGMSKSEKMRPRHDAKYRYLPRPTFSSQSQRHSTSLFEPKSSLAGFDNPHSTSLFGQPNSSLADLASLYPSQSQHHSTPLFGQHKSSEAGFDNPHSTSLFGQPKSSLAGFASLYPSQSQEHPAGLFQPKSLQTDKLASSLYPNNLHDGEQDAKEDTGEDKTARNAAQAARTPNTLFDLNTHEADVKSKETGGDSRAERLQALETGFNTLAKSVAQLSADLSELKSLLEQLGFKLAEETKPHTASTADAAGALDPVPPTLTSTSTQNSNTAKDKDVPSYLTEAQEQGSILFGKLREEGSAFLAYLKERKEIW